MPSNPDPAVELAEKLKECLLLDGDTLLDFDTTHAAEIRRALEGE